jgi:signal transduction histidine kinase
MRMERAELLDLAVAAVLAATGVPPYLDRPAVAAAQLGLSAAVAVRRRFPLPATVAVAALFVLQAALSPGGDAPEDQVVLVAVPLLGYTVAAYRRRPIAVAGLAILLVGVLTETRLSGGGDYSFNVGFVLVGWLPGAVMFGRRLELRRLADERDELVDRVAAEERARLARELHDIVSHSVGVMTVQAAAAEQVLDLAPDAARRALIEVQQVGHETVLELHRLLGLLRGGDPAGTVPRPGLAQLPDLVPDLQIVGEPRPLPDALELSAYRIVQEAITNAGKHAPGSDVRVRLIYRPEALMVEVDDDGAVLPVRPGPGGQGLIGMQERVALFGGSLSAAPRIGGGFRVSARLPVQA